MSTTLANKLNTAQRRVALGLVVATLATAANVWQAFQLRAARANLEAARACMTEARVALTAGDRAVAQRWLRDAESATRGADCVTE